MNRRLTAQFRVRSTRLKFLVATTAASLSLLAMSFVFSARGEGGEPRYFAITHARIVPVSGPVIEDGTVVVAKGLIESVGTSVTIPPEAWVIEGKGLTVYPGLIDAGTTVGLAEENGTDSNRAKGGASAPPALGPEGRPGTSPWRVVADEVKTDDKRIET